MKNISGWARLALVHRRKALTSGLRPMPSGSPESGAWRAWLFDSLGALLQAHGAVGASVAMAYQGRVIAEFAWGEAIRGGAPATPDTKYRIASISKMLGSLAVMRLVEQGALALDADISELLGFAVRNPKWPERPITLRQLMTHSSGLCDTGDYDRVLGTPDMPTVKTLLTERASRNFRTTAPGTAFLYSNFGTGVIGCLVEAATGLELDAVCRQFLFTPLDMDASFHPQRVAQKERMANSYRVPGGALGYDSQAIAQSPLPGGADPMMHYTVLPGKLMISARDALRLMLALLGDGSTDGVRLLQPETARRMRTDQGGCGSVAKPVGRGLNVSFAEEIMAPRRTLIGHQGMAYGAVSGAWGDPEDGSGVVLLTNGASMRRCGPVARIVQDVTAAYYYAVAAWDGAG